MYVCMLRYSPKRMRHVCWSTYVLRCWRTYVCGTYAAETDASRMLAHVCGTYAGARTYAVRMLLKRMRHVCWRTYAVRMLTRRSVYTYADLCYTYA